MTNLLHGAARSTSRVAASGIFATILFGASALHAQSTATAVQLFDEAEALNAQGKYAEACPKYAESYRQDPQLVVLLYLGECYEKNGQIASAWGAFREAEELALKKNDERAAQAKERVAALEPRLSRLTIEVPEDVRVDGLVIKRDGVEVTAAVWGTAAPIDAGKHRIEARAPGYESWTTEVVVEGEGTAQNVSVAALKKSATSSGALSASSGSTGDGDTQRIGAIALGGVGIVAVGVAGFFGLSAQSKQSDSDEYCNASGFCEERGVSLREEASQNALIATISSVVGVAALGGAGVLWFTAPSKEEEQRSSARLTPGSDSPNGWTVNFGGTF